MCAFAFSEHKQYLDGKLLIKISMIAFCNFAYLFPLESTF